MSQFDGYESLPELAWDRYRARYGDVRRLDRILEAEGDDANRYQVCKQADTVMLGHLVTPRQHRDLLRRLGYRLNDDLWGRTVEYHLARTSHGSTLSSLVHGWVTARTRPEQAWRLFRESLLGDVADLQGGTTGEGVHLGAMEGTFDLMQRSLSGLSSERGALCLDPAPLPEMLSYGFYCATGAIGPSRSGCGRESAP